MNSTQKFLYDFMNIIIFKPKSINNGLYKGVQIITAYTSQPKKWGILIFVKILQLILNYENAGYYNIGHLENIM